MQENRRQERTTQEVLAREKKFWKQNQLWGMLLAVVLIFYTALGSGFSVATGAEALTLTLHSGEVCTIPYSSITQVRLLEEPEFGTMVEGEQTRQGSSGIWEHPQWGRYTLCVYASGGSALWLQTQEACYVVNLSSPEETEQLYQIIQQKSAVSQ